jgi:glucose 1-dehydrogenase
MKAITVEPHKAGSACLEEIAEPDVRDGSVLVEAIAVGVCGTDVEIVEGKYGWAPPGHYDGDSEWRPERRLVGGSCF